MKKILVALVFISTSAYGMVYTWTDSKGIAHYTNKEYEVPARYRAKLKFLYPEQLGTSVSSTPSASSVPQQADQPQPAQQSTQQEKPDGQPKIDPPVIAPEPQKSVPDQPVKRGRRSRPSRTSSDE